MQKTKIYKYSSKKIRIILPVLAILSSVVISHPVPDAFSTNENGKMYQGSTSRINHSSIESVNTTKQEKQKTFEWEYAAPESVGLSSKKIDSLIVLHKNMKTKKLLIIKDDKIICEWYAPGFEDSVSRHYSASLSKALVGGMSLLIALNDRLIFPDAPACNYIIPWKQDNQKSKITIRHLATHTSGLENAEVSLEEQNTMKAKGLHTHMDLAGWKGQFWKQDPDPFSVSRDSAKVLFTPGTRYDYSNPGIGMLTYAVTSAIRGTKYEDVRQLLKERVYMPIGLKDSDWNIGYGKTFETEGLKLVPSWGGGSFTAHGVARIGKLMMQKGSWQSQQLIDSTWVERVIRYQGTALASDNPDVVIGDQRIQNPIPATTLGWYSNNL
ncbi:MAG: serine hydrolase, partial [Cyclobacteriaceae bacterium]|nr:serine hydrolase [Cyclobacteriaceae bacterium]